jgi:hypothetical protein
MRYFMLLISRMFNLKQQRKKKRKNIMARKTLAKKVKVLNLLSKGLPVTWKALRSKFDLTSPRAMVDQLRSEGHMIYINNSSNGTSYRLGTPTKSIIAAGIRKLYGPFKYAYSA